MSKTHSNPDNLNRQLSLFDHISPEDSRPLPLLVAEKWGFPLQHYEPNEEQPEHLYAVQDWVVGLGATKRTARRIVQEIRAVIELPTIELPYQTAGGIFQMDFSNEKALYAIAQEMRPMERRPQLEAIRNYLVAAGVALDEARRDPDKAAELVDALSRHHKIRLEGIVERNELTAWISQNIKQAFNYGLFTNIEYKGLFGRDAKMLREQTGVRNPREAMTTEGLAFVSAAEAACHRLLNNRQTVTSVEAYQIMGQVAQAIGVNVRALQDLVGVDLATGRPLLKAPDPS